MERGLSSASIKLNGNINHRNSTYWTTQNPNITWEQTMEAEVLMVWAGIWSQGVIGPYFFDSTVTGQSYLKRLNNYFHPVFCDLLDNELIFLSRMTC